MRIVEQKAMERVIELLQRDRTGSHEVMTALSHLEQIRTALATEKPEDPEVAMWNDFRSALDRFADKSKMRVKVSIRPQKGQDGARIDIDLNDPRLLALRQQR